MMIENFGNIVKVVNPQSPKVIFSAFAALILCGLIVFVVQLESAEKQVKNISKPAAPYSANRKLQAVEANRTQRKVSSASMMVKEKEAGIEKRDVNSKPQLNYQKIVTQLLSDNKLLQLKLNETLQALKRCMQEDFSICQNKAIECVKHHVKEEDNEEKKHIKNGVKSNTTSVKFYKDEKTSPAKIDVAYVSKKSLHRSKIIGNMFTTPLHTTNIAAKQTNDTIATDAAATPALSSVIHFTKNFSNISNSRLDNLPTTSNHLYANNNVKNNFTTTDI